MLSIQHEQWMEKAIEMACQAESLGEVPVGAVIVRNGQLIARAHNLVEGRNDATAHAEILAIREASRFIKNWRLSGVSLYTTLEPCHMCWGAIINARIESVYFGVSDPQLDPMFRELILSRYSLNVKGGILEERIGAMLRQFFKTLRNDSTKKSV